MLQDPECLYKETIQLPNLDTAISRCEALINRAGLAAVVIVNQKNRGFYIEVGMRSQIGYEWRKDYEIPTRD